MAPRNHFIALLGQHFPGTVAVDRAAADCLPTDKGAYLLAIELPERLPARLRDRAFTLEAGWYAYAGSANGPGGLRARLSRHFRHEKKPHWHVDQLTVAAKGMFALAFPSGSECEIVARLRQHPSITFPEPGFGSSDCRRCTAHLLRVNLAVMAGPKG